MSNAVNSGRQRERFRLAMCIGPAISMMLALAQIMQLIINDPSAAFSEEIVSQLEAPASNAAPSTGNRLGYHSFFRSKRYAEHHATDRRSFVLTSRNLAGDQLTPTLFRPSIWPHGDSTDPPLSATVQEDSKSVVADNGKYPGESTFVTSYRNDVIVSVDHFMEIDPQGKTVVPVQRNKEISYVTCRFMDYQYAFFFPHFAQQVFRCWSFYRANLDKSPVFVTGQNEYHWKLAMQKDFNRGLLSVLEYAGVQILHPSSTIISGPNGRKSLSGRTKGPILQPNQNHFQMASTEDMASFRQNLMASRNLTDVTSTSCGQPPGSPRIAILTRSRVRRIKNAKEIATSLQRHYKFTRTIPVVYFEKAPFRSQVAVMGSVDILITPHGAQETGVAFLPRCGGVLELLPDGYFFPRFYGTLASTAGVEHAYIYLAKNTSDDTVDIKMRDVTFLYPSFEKVQEGVDILLERRQRCCESLTRQESYTRKLLSALDDELGSHDQLLALDDKSGSPDQFVPFEDEAIFHDQAEALSTTEGFDHSDNQKQ
jgi:Glycosyltransferase 61